jgi:hypothetical protein
MNILFSCIDLNKSEEESPVEKPVALVEANSVRGSNHLHNCEKNISTDVLKSWSWTERSGMCTRAKRTTSFCVAGE